MGVDDTDVEIGRERRRKSTKVTEVIDRERLEPRERGKRAAREIKGRESEEWFTTEGTGCRGWGGAVSCTRAEEDEFPSDAIRSETGRKSSFERLH